MKMILLMIDGKPVNVDEKIVDFVGGEGRKNNKKKREWEFEEI